MIKILTIFQINVVKPKNNRKAYSIYESQESPLPMIVNIVSIISFLKSYKKQKVF